MRGGRNQQIVHICPREAWRTAQDDGEYLAASLASEGFIHASQPEQVLRVANQFYRGIPDLVLLWIDLQLVRAPIRWENVDGDLFPHIYGPLNTDAVTAVTGLLPDKDGHYDRLSDP